MSYKGVVQNGVVVLPPEAKLAEGTEVNVDLVKPARPFTERYAEFIGIIKDGPSDLAEHHDHYAHGKPKPESGLR